MAKTLQNVLTHKFAIVECDEIGALADKLNERHLKQFFSNHSEDADDMSLCLLTAHNALSGIASIAEDSLRFEALKKIVLATKRSIAIVQKDKAKHQEWLNLVFILSHLLALPIAEQGKKTATIQAHKVATPVKPANTPIQGKKTAIVTPSIVPMVRWFILALLCLMLYVGMMFFAPAGNQGAVFVFSFTFIGILMFFVRKIAHNEKEAIDAVKRYVALQLHKRAVRQRARHIYHKRIMRNRIRAMVFIGLSSFIALIVVSNVVYFMHNYAISDVLFTLQQDMLYVILVSVASFVALRYAQSSK